MTKLIFSMTKVRHIPGIKLLKNVSSSITSHGQDKNVHHHIFFIDKYFPPEFFMSFGIFPALENKIAVFQVFHVTLGLLAFFNFGVICLE